jgi:hypothetical protein
MVEAALGERRKGVRRHEMVFKLGWRSTFRRDKIKIQIKSGIEETQARNYLSAIAWFSVALDNIEEEETYCFNKIGSFHHWIDPNEKAAAHEALLTYCNSMRGIAYKILVIIFLDQGNMTCPHGLYQNLS